VCTIRETKYELAPRYIIVHVFIKNCCMTFVDSIRLHFHFNILHKSDVETHYPIVCNKGSRVANKRTFQSLKDEGHGNELSNRGIYQIPNHVSVQCWKVSACRIHPIEDTNLTASLLGIDFSQSTLTMERSGILHSSHPFFIVVYASM